MITSDAAYELARDCQQVAYYKDGGYTPVYTLDIARFAQTVEQCTVAEIVEYLRSQTTGQGVEFTTVYHNLAKILELKYEHSS